MKTWCSPADVRYREVPPFFDDAMSFENGSGPITAFSGRVVEKVMDDFFNMLLRAAALVNSWRSAVEVPNGDTV